MRLFYRFALILLLAAGALTPPPAAHAADLTAATEAELVAAIAAVNAAGAGAHTITLTADITLTAATPALDNATATSLTLEGSEYTLEGGGHGPVLSVAAGTTAAIRNVTISGGVGERGGGIFSAGKLTVASSYLVGNRAGRGGGIYTEAVAGGASLTVTDADLSGNEANMGGGIHVYAAGDHVAGVSLSRVSLGHNIAAVDGGGVGLLAETGGVVNLTMTDAALRDNSGQQGGGLGILADGGRVSANVVRSTLDHNFAQAGAGIFHGAQNDGATQLDVVLSTLSRNRAGNAGGGVANWARGGGTARLTLFNATLSGNSAGAGGGGGLHSAVADGSAAANLAYSTLAGNTAGGGGGGIHTVAVGGAATATLTATIVANGIGPGPDCARPSGSIISTGYNLAGDGTCFLTQGSDQPVTDPGLKPLALNPPGATETHALAFATAAVDRIPPGAAGCGTIITGDQRGAPRPAGARCDVGAFEQGSGDVVVFRSYLSVVGVKLGRGSVFSRTVGQWSVRPY